MANKDNSQGQPLHQGEAAEPDTATKGSLNSVIGNWHGWLTFILLFLVLEIAVLSIEQARWITPQPSLTLVLVLTMLITLALVKIRFNIVAKYAVAFFMGILITMWQAFNLIPADEAASRFDQLIITLQSWWQTTGAATPSEETISFAIFLTVLTCLMGYISTLFVLRNRNIWVAVALGGITILVNLSNLPDSYYVFFGFYFFAAMLLIAQNRIAKRYSLLKHAAGFSKRGLLYLTASLLCLILLAGSISWVTPEIQAPQLQTLIATKILWKHDIEESRLNLFNSVPSKQVLSTSNTRRDLHFSEKWHQGNKIHFTISAEHPSYWQVNVYDTYTSQGWTNSPASEYLLEQDSAWSGVSNLSEAGMTTYTVTTNLNTDIVLTAGTFISADSPVVINVGTQDIISVTTPRLLRPKEDYTVTSHTSSARPTDLVGIGTNYPQYISDNYLQLPADFPESVTELSESLTAEAESPYAKVVAIDNYLSQIPYEVEIEKPPQNTDVVEYFLFTQKSGFCLYYASAMAVMLRSVDVPSRLVVGYLPGEPGDEIGQYVLRDKHYHTWPQVYFPGYGWMDLEVTPSSTDSEVSVEIPWVSDRVIEDLPQWDVWSDWQLYAPQLDSTASTPGKVPDYTGILRGRLPFADALGKTLLYTILGIIIITLLLFPVLTLRSAFYRWLWRVDRSNSASMVYSKMYRLASLAKLAPRPQQTPLEYTAELTKVFPEQTKALDSITKTYVENRFGRKTSLELFEEANLLKARCSVFDTLLKRAGLLKKLFRKRL